MSKYLLQPIISVNDVKYSDASKNILPKSNFLRHNLCQVLILQNCELINKCDICLLFNQNIKCTFSVFLALFS